MNNLEYKLHRTVIKSFEGVRTLQLSLDLFQDRVLDYVITESNWDGNEFSTVEISAKDYCNLSGTDVNGFYTYFKKHIDEIDSVNLWLEKNGILHKLRCFNKTELDKNTGVVYIQLHSDMHFITSREGQFIKYELLMSFAMRGKYTKNLFEKLLTYVYHQKTYVNIETVKGWLKIDGVAAYNNAANLRIKVLDPAINEINLVSELTVCYEFVYGGRGGKKAVGINFFIERKGFIEEQTARNIAQDRIFAKTGQCAGQMNVFQCFGPPDMEIKTREN